MTLCSEDNVEHFQGAQWTSAVRCSFIYRTSLVIVLRLEWDYRKSSRSKRWSTHGTVFLNKRTKRIPLFLLHCLTSESHNCAFSTEFSPSFLFQKAATVSLAPALAFFLPPLTTILLSFSIDTLYLEMCHLPSICLPNRTKEATATQVLQVAKEHLYQYKHKNPFEHLKNS